MKILWAQKDSRDKGRNEIKNYIKENIIGKISFSHPAFEGLVATPNKYLYRELYHVGDIAKLSKTYDTLMHLERYLTKDAKIFQEKVIHNHNGGAGKIFILQSEYKGDSYVNPPALSATWCVPLAILCRTVEVTLSSKLLFNRLTGT